MRTAQRRAWPGQEENQSYQHFLHLSQEIRPPHSGQKQRRQPSCPLSPSGGGLAVSPGWIKKSTSGVVGMPFTPKACQAHLTLQAVLYSPLPNPPWNPIHPRPVPLTVAPWTRSSTQSPVSLWVPSLGVPMVSCSTGVHTRTRKATTWWCT